MEKDPQIQFLHFSTKTYMHQGSIELLRGVTISAELTMQQRDIKSCPPPKKVKIQQDENKQSLVSVNDKHIKPLPDPFSFPNKYSPKITIALNKLIPPPTLEKFITAVGRAVFTLKCYPISKWLPLTFHSFHLLHTENICNITRGGARRARTPGGRGEATTGSHPIRSVYLDVLSNFKVVTPYLSFVPSPPHGKHLQYHQRSHESQDTRRKRRTNHWQSSHTQVV